MRAEYKESWQRIKSRALVRIAEHGDSWRDWCQAKTDEDRELLIIEAVWQLAYEGSSNKKQMRDLRSAELAQKKLEKTEEEERQMYEQLKRKFG